MDLYYKLSSNVQIFPRCVHDLVMNELLHVRMPNEYFIHVIYLLFLPTETIWSLYGINNIIKNYLTFTCIIYLIYQIRLPIVIGESEWCLMEHKIINYLTTIILSILFPIAW